MEVIPRLLGASEIGVEKKADSIFAGHSLLQP